MELCEIILNFSMKENCAEVKNTKNSTFLPSKLFFIKLILIFFNIIKKLPSLYRVSFFNNLSNFFQTWCQKGTSQHYFHAKSFRRKQWHDKSGRISNWWGMSTNNCNCTLIKIKTVLLNRKFSKIKWNQIMVDNSEMKSDSNGGIHLKMLKIFVSTCAR